MVQAIAISEGTILRSLRDGFGLERSGELNFFSEWQDDLPVLTDNDI